MQSFGREEHEFDRFHDSVKDFTGAFIRMHMHSMLYWLVIGTAFGLGLAVIFGVGGYMAYSNPQKFTIGELWIFFNTLWSISTTPSSNSAAAAPTCEEYGQHAPLL